MHVVCRGNPFLHSTCTLSEISQHYGDDDDNDDDNNNNKPTLKSRTLFLLLTNPTIH